MKKLLSIFLGLGAFILMLSLNLKYAVDDYGIGETKAALQVFGQRSDSAYSSWTHPITSSIFRVSDTSSSWIPGACEEHRSYLATKRVGKCAGYHTGEVLYQEIESYYCDISMFNWGSCKQGMKVTTYNACGYALDLESYDKIKPIECNMFSNM